MTAVRAHLRPDPAKQPPYFRTEVSLDFVEVDIRPEELEEQGWVYIGKPGEPVVADARVLDVVRRWHDDTHEGPWRWCTHDLCDELRGRPEQGG